MPTTKSLEFCGGPHVRNTSELGRFQIVKEQSVGTGLRRIRAVLTPVQGPRNVAMSELVCRRAGATPHALPAT